MHPEVISEEYGIPAAQARTLIRRETRRALAGRWEAWAWLAGSLGVAAALHLAQPGNGLCALLIGTGALLVWYQVGRFLAEPAVHAAARGASGRAATMGGPTHHPESPCPPSPPARNAASRTSIPTAR